MQIGVNTMKLLNKFKIRGWALAMILFALTFPTCGQTAVESKDSASFHLGYDSLLNKVDVLPFENHQVYVKYYFRWRSEYGGDQVERFGIVSLVGDSIHEYFKMRPFTKGSPIETPVRVNDFVVSKAVYLMDNSIKKDFLGLSDSGHYLVQPSVVNGKYFYPLNAIRVFIISDGHREKLGFAKHGRKELSTEKIESKKEFVGFFDWLFDFERPQSDAYPRMNGMRRE